jgi:UDP-2,4-diacetamido-2,4,6-trideoxy-beta-L-altropyranose hydrolase
MSLAIRVDAGPAMGAGHFMRCLALAQEWRRRGGEVRFLTHDPQGRFLDRLHREGFRARGLESPTDIEELLGALAAAPVHWVVLDGYHFHGEMQQALKDRGHRLLVLDDYQHLPRYCADLILNQNYGAQAFSYQTAPGAQLLLGTDYVLLREEFLRAAPADKEIPEIARNLLVTLGGADQANHTFQVMEALNLVEAPLTVKVVLGPSNPHLEMIRAAAQQSRHRLEILQDVENMAPLMAWADLAVSAGGSTIWELAFMGVPAIFGVVADNQKNAVLALARAGYPAFLDLGRATIEELGYAVAALAADQSLRQRLSLTGRDLIDGRGAARVSQAMTGIKLRVLFLGGNLSLDLAVWLREQGEEVEYVEEKVDPHFVRRYNPDVIVSYNYRYILKKDIFAIPPRGAINLHSSLLPWNRGAHPNVWSFLEGTPKGVTIHYIDEGIDTGDILLQKEVVLEADRETLKSSYLKLHQEMQQLFKDHWEQLKSGFIPPRPQSGDGTLHYLRDSEQFAPLIQEKGWDTPVAALTGLYRSHPGKAELTYENAFGNQR